MSVTSFAVVVLQALKAHSLASWGGGRSEIPPDESRRNPGWLTQKSSTPNRFPPGVWLQGESTGMLLPKDWASWGLQHMDLGNAQAEIVQRVGSFKRERAAVVSWMCA